MAKEKGNSSYLPLYIAGGIAAGITGVCAAIYYYYCKAHKNDPATTSHTEKKTDDLEKVVSDTHTTPKPSRHSAAQDHNIALSPSLHFSQQNISINIVPVQQQGLDAQQLFRQDILSQTALRQEFQDHLTAHKAEVKLLLEQNKVAISNEVKTLKEWSQQKVLELSQKLEAAQFADQKQKEVILKYVFDTQIEQSDIIANLKGLVDNLPEADRMQFLGLVQQDIANDFTNRLEQIGMSDIAPQLMGIADLDIQE